MISHEPPGYSCPFCRIIAGHEDELNSEGDSYGCTGISTRQHNEPDGYQDVWHYHLHVFPRYADDRLYGSVPLPDHATAAERRPYADRLRNALAE